MIERYMKSLYHENKTILVVRFRDPLAGERACPAEDCGGLWRYQEILEILKDPKHEEYEHYREWLGGEFDPEEFDVNKVNGLFERT